MRNYWNKTNLKDTPLLPLIFCIVDIQTHILIGCIFILKGILWNDKVNVSDFIKLYGGTIKLMYLQAYNWV